MVMFSYTETLVFKKLQPHLATDALWGAKSLTSLKLHQVIILLPLLT